MGGSDRWGWAGGRIGGAGLGWGAARLGWTGGAGRWVGPVGHSYVGFSGVRSGWVGGSGQPCAMADSRVVARFLVVACVCLPAVGGCGSAAGAEGCGRRAGAVVEAGGGSGGAGCGVRVGWTGVGYAPAGAGGDRGRGDGGAAVRVEGVGKPPTKPAHPRPPRPPATKPPKPPAPKPPVLGVVGPAGVRPVMTKLAGVRPVMTKPAGVRPLEPRPSESGPPGAKVPGVRPAALQVGVGSVGGGGGGELDWPVERGGSAVDSGGGGSGGSGGGAGRSVVDRPFGSGWRVVASRERAAPGQRAEVVGLGDVAGGGQKVAGAGRWPFVASAVDAGVRGEVGVPGGGESVRAGGWVCPMVDGLRVGGVVEWAVFGFVVGVVFALGIGIGIGSVGLRRS